MGFLLRRLLTEYTLDHGIAEERLAQTLAPVTYMFCLK